MDNQNLFSQSYDQITKQILGTGNNYFQMLGNPQSFNWPVAASGQLAPEAYQLMSAAPVYSPVATFGGVGTSTLFDNYRQIFGHVGFNNSPEIEQQIKDLSDNVTAAQNEVTKTWTNANTAYLTAKQNGGVIFEAQYPSIAEWMAGPGSNYATEAETWTKKGGCNSQADTVSECCKPANGTVGCIGTHGTPNQFAKRRRRTSRMDQSGQRSWSAGMAAQFHHFNFESKLASGTDQRHHR